jgi:DNA-binding transcriptional LysR family regulator
MGMLLASVSSGIGYGILPRVFCRDSILQGKFKEILKDFKVYPEWGIFAIYPERRYLPIKVTKFIEHLKYNLRNRPKELYFPC